MKKDNKKLTLEKYVLIAEEMRTSGNYMIDIKKYTPQEIETIANLVHYDGVFEFAKATKDMDIRRIKAEVEYLEAEEKRYIAKAQFG